MILYLPILVGSPSGKSTEPWIDDGEPSVLERLLVSSGDPLEPSTWGAEPSVSDRCFVSSIARSLTTTHLTRQSEPLSHPKLGRRRGAERLASSAKWLSAPCRGVPRQRFNHARNE